MEEIAMIDVDNMPGWENYDEMIDQEQLYPAWMEEPPLPVDSYDSEYDR
jgi:hypothetical protein